MSMAVVASLILAIPAPSDAEEILCFGLTPTIVGTSGDDVLTGTSDPDVIHGLDGNDVIDGLDGDDTICGGAGDDELTGGPGDDTISGGRNTDLIYGKGGADVLSGSRGFDTIYGGAGDDVIFGKKGDDNIDGGNGEDTLNGDGGDDVLLGRAHPDIVDGGAGTDRCAGNTEISCELEVIDFEFQQFLINQAVPQADSSQATEDRVGTVENRAGIVRVFLAANQAGIESPAVHLYYKRSGQVERLKLTGPATVPTDPQESDLATTYNYEFDETLLRPGTKVYVLIDRKNKVFEKNEENNRYPGSGWNDIDTRDVPKFKVTVVPITIEGGGAASISQSQAEALLEKTLKVHAIGNYDINVRDNYLFEDPTGTSSDWGTLLVEMANLRAAENPNRQYHALLPYGLSPGIGGIGYVGLPAAVSIQDEETIAHETGHNLNLPHNPCSGEGNPDLDYPYAGGGIGTWGYDIVTGALYDPTVYKDLMTYCGPEWISDYSFDKVLDYRSAAWGWETQSVGLAPAGTGTVVQFSGTLPATEAQVATQSPLVVVDTAPAIRSVEVVSRAVALPEPGEHTLVGRDAAGTVVASVSFRSYAIDHAAGAFFIFSIEVANEDLSRISSWSIEEAGKAVASHPAG